MYKTTLYESDFKMNSFPLGIPMRFENERLLWTVNEVYTKRECSHLIKTIEQSQPQPATNNFSYRNQDRAIRDDIIYYFFMFLWFTPPPFFVHPLLMTFGN